MEEYRFIQAWGEHARSGQYYIDQEIRRARKENAPADAIYSRGDGLWATVDNIRDGQLRQQIQGVA